MRPILLLLVAFAFAYDDDNWMENISGGRRLGTLAVPGTHDSGAYDILEHVGEAQDWSIDHQLANGIRFLDIRLSNKDKDSSDFEIRHGPLHLGSFKHLVMDRVENFLTNHPNETIFMSLSDEATLDVKRLYRLFLRNSAYRFYQDPISPSTTLQTVRGRIVVFNRYDSQRDDIGINWKGGQLDIQDNYNLDVECKDIPWPHMEKKTVCKWIPYLKPSHKTICKKICIPFVGCKTICQTIPIMVWSKKKVCVTVKVPVIGKKLICSFAVGLDYPKKARQVKQHLIKAADNYGSEYFYVNFASANYKGIYIGNNAKVANRAVKDYFDSHSKRVGSIVPMDYPNRATGVIRSIIRNNFNGN